MTLCFKVKEIEITLYQNCSNCSFPMGILRKNQFHVLVKFNNKECITVSQCGTTGGCLMVFIMSCIAYLNTSSQLGHFHDFGPLSSTVRILALIPGDTWSTSSK